MDNLDHSFLSLNRTSLSERRSTKIIYTKKLFIRNPPYGTVRKFELLKFSKWRESWFFLFGIELLMFESYSSKKLFTSTKTLKLSKNSPAVELFPETRSMLETKCVGDKLGWGHLSSEAKASEPFNIHIFV